MFITLSSCDVNEPKKEKAKPEGYQEDIPWPSLADSPWPMCFHDPQATGRTKYKGPSYGIVEWVLDSLINYESSPVIGEDGTVYTCVPTTYSAGKQKYWGLIAIDPNGIIKWKFDLGFLAELIPAPLLSSDKSIYVFGGWTGIDTLYSVSTEGKLKWKKRLPTKVYHHVSQSSAVLDKNGNLYFVDVNGNIYCFDKNGNEIWIKKHANIPNLVRQFSFSPDGRIIYYGSSKVSLCAISAETGDLLWTFGNVGTHMTPLIDSQGNIYTIIKTKNDWEQELVCIDKDTNIKWKFIFYEHNLESSFTQPCMDRYGNIFFGSDTIYSVSYKGELRWKYSENEFNIISSIICDGMNNIYFAIIRGFLQSSLLSFSTEGKLLTKINLPGDIGNCSIGFNQKIYCPAIFADKLYSLK